MTTNNDISELLARSKLFAGLTPQLRDAIAKDMRPVKFSAGEHIFSRGDEGRELYLVVEGRVRLSVVSLDGRELSFTHATDGDIFGEIAVLDGEQRSADATAVTKVSAMHLSKASFERQIDASPDFARAMIRFLCQRIRNTDMQLWGVALHRIEVRLAGYILSRMEQTEGASPAKDGRVTVDLGMSQGELSLLLGASRPKVNAALMMLEDCGAIVRNGNTLSCNRQELEQIAEVE